MSSENGAEASLASHPKTSKTLGGAWEITFSFAQKWQKEPGRNVKIPRKCWVGKNCQFDGYFNWHFKHSFWGPIKPHVLHVWFLASHGDFCRLKGVLNHWLDIHSVLMKSPWNTIRSPSSDHCIPVIFHQTPMKISWKLHYTCKSKTSQSRSQ